MLEQEMNKGRPKQDRRGIKGVKEGKEMCCCYGRGSVFTW